MYQLLTMFLNFIQQQPPKSILISPDTVKFYASFLHSSATINALYIHFPAGHVSQELLRVPLAAPGELDKRQLIRITVGTNPPATDNDPLIGITDGSNRNQFLIIQHGSTSSNFNVCYIQRRNVQ